MLNYFINLPARTYVILASLLLVIQAGALFLLGQPTICTCGYIKFWEGVVLSIGNSQHLTDWYTFSHLIHGFIFYFVIWIAFPRMPVLPRFLLALGVEVGWEIFENTPWIINHYREQALAVGYTGDSILNSIADTLAMVVGFIMARRMPVWSIVALLLFMEIFTGYFMRDNLTLNIINLIYQFDFIREWQSEG